MNVDVNIRIQVVDGNVDVVADVGVVFVADVGVVLVA